MTLINIGMPLGSFLQSFSDNFGRRPFVLLNIVLLIFFGLISVFSWSFPVFVVSRFFYEVGIGISLPLSNFYTSEISPAAQRGPFMGKLWIIWVFGYLLSCTLGFFFLASNQWRLVLLILCVPSFFALLFFFLYC